MTIGGLPFNMSSNYFPVGTVCLRGPSLTFSNNQTYLFALGNYGQNSFVIGGSGPQPPTSNPNLQMANTPTIVIAQLTYSTV